jgi:hypothetical protein
MGDQRALTPAISQRAAARRNPKTAPKELVDELVRKSISSELLV